MAKCNIGYLFEAEIAANGQEGLEQFIEVYIIYTGLENIYGKTFHVESIEFEEYETNLCNILVQFP